MLRLKLTPEYQAARAALTKNARAALTIVEQGISEAPDHRVKRRDRSDGAVIDTSAEGLFVAFRVISPTVVELLDVIDLKQVS